MLIDAVAEAGRKMQRYGKPGGGERGGGRAAAFDGQDLIGGTVDEQHFRLGRDLVEMIGAGKVAGVADDQRRRQLAPEADVQRHHGALAEADQHEAVGRHAPTFELGVQESDRDRGRPQERLLQRSASSRMVSGNHWRPPGTIGQACGACGETNATSGRKGAQLSAMS